MPLSPPTSFLHANSSSALWLCICFLFPHGWTRMWPETLCQITQFCFFALSSPLDAMREDDRHGPPRLQPGIGGIFINNCQSSLHPSIRLSVSQLNMLQKQINISLGHLSGACATPNDKQTYNWTNGQTTAATTAVATTVIAATTTAATTCCLHWMPN